MEKYYHQTDQVLQEISTYFTNRLVPFWFNNCIDEKFGGYITNFDETGNPMEINQKLIVPQTRMIWAMSMYALRFKNREKQFLSAAKNGFDFFTKHFWDNEYKGWFWSVARDGSLIDGAKILYGQCFAIYALSQYYLSSHDEKALEFACLSFDTLIKFATDSFNGGYYENMERDWTICETGYAGGDRKSMDIYIHFIEALSVLFAASGEHIHKRKLEELLLLVNSKMIQKKQGCVFNQFDLAFNPIPAYYVKRTWNSDIERNRISSPPPDAVPFGYNVELAWLMNKATTILRKPDGFYLNLTKKLVDYVLKYGFDNERGGIYYDGTHDGIVLRYDKEFWQNAELLIALLDMYEQTGLKKYIEAFFITWDFCKNFFINKNTGEWNQLVTKEGAVLIDELIVWRSAYHTSRSMMECIDRLTRIKAKHEKDE